MGSYLERYSDVIERGSDNLRIGEVIPHLQRNERVLHVGEPVHVRSHELAFTHGFEFVFERLLGDRVP